MLPPGYRIGPVIGGGNKSVVRVVTHVDSGERTACKTMLASNPRAANEIDALRAMYGCPLVARLVGVRRTDAFVHVLTEYHAGGTLADVRDLDEAGTCAAAHVRRVLQALDVVHARGWLHRDVKPENFVLGPEGAIAIDFGLAERLPFAQDGAPAGTLPYMAPELFSGRCGPESDVWSAGVMAAELVTGALPFDDSGTRALVRKILAGGYHPRAGDAAFADFVATVLVRDPRRRPSAREALSHPWLGGTRCPPRP